MPTIESKKLTKNDIGRKVIYTSPHGTKEEGVISSFIDDRTYVFVQFRGPNGEACPENHLTWSLNHGK